MIHRETRWAVQTFAAARLHIVIFDSSVNRSKISLADAAKVASTLTVDMLRVLACFDSAALILAATLAGVAA